MGNLSASAPKNNYVKFSDKLADSMNNIARMIQENRQMIDSIQEVALELTGVVDSLHTLTVKYARLANQILDLLLPVVQTLPLIPKSARDLLSDLERWTQRIIDNEVATARTIADVKSGLQNGDVGRLKSHTADLRAMSKTLSQLVPSGR